MPRVRVLSESGEPRTVEFETELSIGRDRSNQVVLADPSCSRHHAVIRRRGTEFVVADLGSSAGVLLNGRRVTEEPLGPGDRLQIGRATLVFEDGPAEAVTVIDDAAPVRRTRVWRESGSVPRVGDLYEILKRIAGRTGTLEVLQELCDGVRRALRCDVVAAVGRGRIVSSSDGPAKISRSVTAACRREAASYAAEELSGSRSILQERISSALGAPIDSTWMLYADTRESGRQFSGEELEFFGAAAMQAAMALRGAATLDRARSEVRELKRFYSESGRLIGKSQAFLQALEVARKAAAVRSTVLILGESGTGKELAARLVHESGPGGPFVALNCAALVETLLESELFGHEKGAFTGAVRSRPGQFEAADGGTLFLDEVCEMSPAMQAKLLRAIQERRFTRVGGTEPVEVDVRLIAATNRDIAREVEEGRFREDLYFRLAVLTLRLPPLRERREDIPLLAEHFLGTLATQMKKPVKKISAAAIERLSGYSWPGNVRELQNVIERAVVLAEGDTIEPELLLLDSRRPPEEIPLDLQEAEKILILRALQQTGGRKGEAIRLLGISWPTLNKKLKEYGLENS
jgi:two-component system response regulator HydG